MIWINDNVIEDIEHNINYLRVFAKRTMDHYYEIDRDKQTITIKYLRDDTFEIVEDETVISSRLEYKSFTWNLSSYIK